MQSFDIIVILTISLTVIGVFLVNPITQRIVASNEDFIVSFWKSKLDIFEYLLVVVPATAILFLVWHFYQPYYDAITVSLDSPLPNSVIDYLLSFAVSSWPWGLLTMLLHAFIDNRLELDDSKVSKAIYPLHFGIILLFPIMWGILFIILYGPFVIISLLLMSSVYFLFGKIKKAYLYTQVKLQSLSKMTALQISIALISLVFLCAAAVLRVLYW